jgi:penicillin-binding protein 1B
VSIKLKIPGRHTSARHNSAKQHDVVVRTAVAVFAILATVMVGMFTFYYVRYANIVDRRMRGPIFANAAQIYALPPTMRVGERIAAEDIAADLRQAGYSEEGGKNVSNVGTYGHLRDGLKIKPGRESYHPAGEAEIHIKGGKIISISAAGKGDLASYELDPQLITALFEGEQRSKRQLIKYQDIPKMMVDAVLAIEDRRFFQHKGVNYVRLLEAGWIDLRQGRHEQGGSTLTMQISRGFFLTPQKTIRRKLVEMLIALELEQRFSKQQIFELYANQVYMGQRGSFTISGFGEASHAYFNKDLQSITLPEAALLAGLIQRPNYLSPYRSPERALERRNLVLDSMVETRAITRAEAERAKATPLKLAPPNVEATDAPYFVDLVKDTLVSRISEQELNDRSYRIYTTLDPDLQRVAAQSVDDGMKLVDEKITKLRTRKKKVGKGKKAKWETKVLPGPQAQVALVAMDPHTGQVLALVGGRNYGFSQLNHAVAKRPTGSVFKPFVYAAAINTALTGGVTVTSASADPNSGNAPAPVVVTPATYIEDVPSTFSYGDQIYEPRNYKDEYHGQVTARYALAESLNNATVKLAEMVGYDKVADLARAAGITSVKPTPAMALGAYDATPLDMASAYTVFANNGIKLSPLLVTGVRNAKGEPLVTFQSDQKPILDPRVAYVMTDMMAGVLNFGTAFGVRSSGFNAPAAGKTGSSHDAWFAGYTSNLLCMIWVGYDDYSDIRLSGADLAAPIWTEFMKRATTLPQYRDVKPFDQPSGVVDVQLDKVTNALATATCPQIYTAAFIAGTEPKQTCDDALGEHRGILSRILGIGGSKPLPPVPPGGTVQVQGGQPQVANGQQDSGKKKGIFGKIVGIFKEDKPAEPQPNPPPNPPQH